MASTEYDQGYDAMPVSIAPRPEYRASGRPGRTMVQFLEAYHGRDGHPVAGSAHTSLPGQLGR